jgi:hypothetical protein
MPSEKHYPKDVMLPSAECRWRLTPLLPRVFLTLWLLFLPVVHAAPVEVRYPEGVSRGFVTVSSLDGKHLGEGELSQLGKGLDQVESHLSIRLTDGSFHEETVLFSQKRQFKLLSYNLLQRGPSFPHHSEVSLDMGTGMYTFRRTVPGEDPVATTGHLDLPPDTYNGMTITLLKNLVRGASASVHMIDFGPKPKLYEVELTPIDTDSLRAGGVSRDAIHYLLKPKLGWVVRNLAFLLGKVPPEYHFWLLKKQAPAFVKFEGPLYKDGPIWRIEQIGPKLEKDK